MTVPDDELRALVRESIARLQGGRAVPALGSSESAAPVHGSHLRFPLSRGDDGDGACLIEPSVRCNHCGYCQSFGH